jgi:hypothetical protein
MLSIHEIINEVKYNNSNSESSILDLFDELFELEDELYEKSNEIIERTILDIYPFQINDNDKFKQIEIGYSLIVSSKTSTI